MIDVVFLMLIFFICASVGQMVESLLPVQMAAGSIESVAPVEVEKPLGEAWIKLRREGDQTRASLNDGPYQDFALLKQTMMQLAGVAPEIPVILDVRPDVPWGDLIYVYDTCRAAKFESVHIAAEAQDVMRRPTVNDAGERGASVP
jgi:biopolymer transport protein ExbD